MFGFLPEDQRPLPLLEAARQPFCSYVEILSFCISEFLWTNKFIGWVTWLSASSCLIWQEEDTTYLNQSHLSLFFQNIILFIHCQDYVLFYYLGVFRVESSKLSILGGDGRAVAHHVQPLQVQEIHHLFLLLKIPISNRHLFSKLLVLHLPIKGKIIFAFSRRHLTGNIHQVPFL